MANSSTVSVGDIATAAQYNNLRKDALPLSDGNPAGENLTALEEVYFASDEQWYKIDTSDGTKLGVRGVVLANVTSGNTATVQIGGLVSGYSGMTPGADAYIDDSSNADDSATTTGLRWVVYIGWWLSATELIRTNPQNLGQNP